MENVNSYLFIINLFLFKVKRTSNCNILILNVLVLLVFFKCTVSKMTSQMDHTGEIDQILL